MPAETRTRLARYISDINNRKRITNNCLINIWRDVITNTIIPTITTRFEGENNSFIVETHE